MPGWAGPGTSLAPGGGGTDEEEHGEGLVHLAVGVLSVLAAVRVEPSPEGPESALATVARELAGPTLLGVVGVGLLALAVWELLVAVPDIEGRGRHGVALFQRGASLIGTLLYGSLGTWAISAAGGGAAAGLALFGMWRLLCAVRLAVTYSPTGSPGSTIRASRGLTTVFGDGNGCNPLAEPPANVRPLKLG